MGGGVPSHWKYDLSKDKFYRIMVVITIITTIVAGIVVWAVEYRHKPAQTGDEQQATSEASASFDKPITLVAESGKVYVFPDGLKVALKSINDSRCPEGVACIWAGELGATLTVISGTKSEEVILGQTTAPRKETLGYTFLLKTISETTATVVVSQASQAE